MKGLRKVLSEALPRGCRSEWEAFIKERLDVDIVISRPYGYRPNPGDRVRVRTFEDMANSYPNAADGNEIRVGPTMVSHMCDRAGEVLVVAGVGDDQADDEEPEPAWDVWFEPNIEYCWTTHMIEPA